MIPQLTASTTRVASSASVARLASLTAQLSRPITSSPQQQHPPTPPPHQAFSTASAAAMSGTNSTAAGAAAASSTNDAPAPMPRFEKTPIPANPLGPGNFVKTAACLIIGDEVLNGKTKDSNSNYFAKWCFNLGIDVKRIEVVPDDEDDIIEAARRMTAKYDLVLSSGGIGPTPDDITYESMAKAFQAEPLQYSEETLRRMQENMAARRRDWGQQTEEMITARKRMALFPSSNAEIIWPTEELWVPVVRMAGKLCILPGVPRLFEALLDGLEPYVPIDPNRPRPYRLLVHTKMPESNISPFLVRLTEKCKPEGIKVGSYPKWNNGVDVSLIGENLDRLKELASEVEREVDGKLIAQGKIGEQS